MPFNGAGSFTLVTGNPVVTGTVISSTVHNNTNNDIASGLTNCITRDGQSAALANLPMGGFKHTGATSAAANGQYIVYGQSGASLTSLTVGGSTTKGDADQLRLDIANNANTSNGAWQVGWFQTGAGATGRTVGDKLREKAISVLDYGADRTGATNCFAAVLAAWLECLATGRDLYFPTGIYKITSANNFPIGRIDGSTPTSLLDCKNITVFGDGPTTVLRTDTVNGADVLQLNGASNLHIRNLKLTATISGSGAGSNGVSVTGGYDNVTLDHIWCENLPSLDKTTYIDGGKALTIQTPIAGQTVQCGTLKATNIFAKGCVYGFGFEADLLAASTKKTSVDIDIVAEDCRTAVIVSSGAATAAIPDNWTSGVRVRAQAINCMEDVFLARAHGVDVKCQVITTKTKAARILSFNGSKWFSTDTVASVVSLRCSYAHDSQVSVFGNKGDCENMAQIGGATAGSSGLTGATERTVFFIGLLGTAASADIVEINSGGSIAQNCTFACQGTGSPSTTFYAPALNNAIVFGNVSMLKDLLVQGAIQFTHTNGVSSFASVDYDNEAVTFQQTFSSSVNRRVIKVLNHTGSTVFSIRNDGIISTAGRGTASSVSTIKGVLPIYDESNALWGYVPVYTSFS